MKFLFAVVALFALQGCMAKPSGDANMLENLKSMRKKLGEQLTLVYIDTNKVKITISNNTNKLIAELLSFGNKMKTELKAHEGEINDKVKEMKEQLHKVKTFLYTAADEDATKKDDELQRKFNETFTAQLQTLFKSQGPGAIDKFLKNLEHEVMEQVDQSSQDLRRKLDKFNAAIEYF